MVRANLYCFRNSVSGYSPNQLIQYQLLPRLLKRDRIVASFGWFKATSRLGRAPIMDTDYAVDCLPGKKTPFYTSSRRKPPTNNICLFFSSADQQNNEFYRGYPFASTCWKEQVRTRLVLDSICKTGVCSHLVRRNMFPEKTKAPFLINAFFSCPKDPSCIMLTLWLLERSVGKLRLNEVLLDYNHE